MILSSSSSFSGFCAETGWKVIFTMFVFKIALSLIWFSKLLYCTEPAWLYSEGPASPPGPGDIRRASSLTNERCVGPEEKPPLCCQNKCVGTNKTFPLATRLIVSNSLTFSSAFKWCQARGRSKKAYLFPDHLKYPSCAFILKAIAQYGSAFRVLFKATSLFSTPSSGNVRTERVEVSARNYREHCCCCWLLLWLLWWLLLLLVVVIVVVVVVVVVVAAVVVVLVEPIMSL